MAATVQGDGRQEVAAGAGDQEYILLVQGEVRTPTSSRSRLVSVLASGRVSGAATREGA